MAYGIKISSLPSASSINETDVLAGVQGGSTKKFTFANILLWLEDNLSISGVGYVPETREINGYALDDDIDLTFSDVGGIGEASIGYKQTTNIASKSYLVGQYFTLHGVAFRCTTPIAEGTMIVEGTNCERKVIGDVLYEQDWASSLPLSIVDGKLCITYEVDE